MSPSKSMRKKLLWTYVAVLGLFAAFFGIVGISMMSAVDHNEYQAAFVLVVLYLVAGGLVLIPVTVIRVTGVWFGIFIILQLFVPDLNIGERHKHLIPNAVRYIEVVSGLTGVQGLQVMTTDSEGFRTEPRVDYTRKTRFRIVAIGGSTTEDIYIDDRHTWTHHLQENLKAAGMDVEVINTGVAGLRAKHHLETLNYVARFEPDMAIFLIGANDWHDFIRRYRMGFYWDIGIRPTKILLMKAIQNTKLLWRASKHARSKPPPPESFPKHADGITPDVPAEYRETVKKAWPGGQLPQSQGLQFRPETVDARYHAEMMEISRACRAHAVRCMFITQPSRTHADAAPRYQRGSKLLSFETQLWIKALYNRFLLNFAAENGHPSCDLANRVPPTAEVFMDNVHFNLSGTRKVAAVVTDCVLKVLGEVTSGR